MGNLVQHLQRNGAMNPLDPRQIEMQQKLAKLDLLEKDVQNLNSLRLQMARIQVWKICYYIFKINKL